MYDLLWHFYDQFSFGSKIGNTSTIRLDEIMLFAAETISLTISLALWSLLSSLNPWPVRRG